MSLPILQTKLYPPLATEGSVLRSRLIERVQVGLNGGLTVVPAFRMAEGNESLYILQGLRDELSHFLLLSFWKSNEVFSILQAPARLNLKW